MKTGIQKAVERMGSHRLLAERLGVTRQAVQRWVQDGVVPQGRVIQVYDLTGVPVSELNPVLYPRRVVDRE